MPKGSTIRARREVRKVQSGRGPRRHEGQGEGRRERKHTARSKTRSNYITKRELRTEKFLLR